MSVMDIIKKISGNKSETKQKFKQMQEDDRLQTMLEQRKLSANERELEKYMKDQREIQIKNELDKIHKKQNHENWKGDNILKSQTNILKNDRPILKEKNIFLDNKSNIPFMRSEAMFFK